MAGYDWDDVRLLMHVGRRGSLFRAGAELGLAASTISRRLTALEKMAGAVLVERGVDGCRLTERGRALAEIGEQMEGRLGQEAARSASQGSLSGTVTISAGDGFINIVSAAAEAFLRKHPQCLVDFSVDVDFAKVSRGAVDLAIRTVKLNEPSLIYRSLGKVAFALFCSEAFARKLPRTPEPASTDYIALLPPLNQSNHMRAATRAGFARERFRVSSFTGQLQAVRDGLGVAVLPRQLAQGLTEVFREIHLPDMEVYLVTRPTAAKQPHIRACMDEIVAAVRQPT